MIKTNQAILLGNGLNNFVGIQASWKNLLVELSNNQNTENMLQNKEISYPEYFDALSFDNKENTVNKEILKKEICRRLSLWERSGIHDEFLSFAKKNNLPIITTNYDSTLIKQEIFSFHKKNKKFKRGHLLPLQYSQSFTYLYPWSSYYSDHLVSDIKNEFAIWHMHGIACYPNSLLIGASDYASMIAQLKKYLPHDWPLLNENWRGTKTWLDIFFNCDLFIVGLSLESQETSLRWLLMERERYFRKFAERRKVTTYIVNNQYDVMTEGKAYLFSCMNINIARYPDSDSIYEEMDWF